VAEPRSNGGWAGRRFQRILATHFERGKSSIRGRRTSSVRRRKAGRDLTGFFDQVHRSSNVFDYGVQSLASTREGDRYRTNLVVRRYGEALFPVDVLVTFRNGERVTEHWDGAARWKLYTFERPVQALSAQVDPDRVLLLDVNYTNNSNTLEPKGRAAAAKWSMKWMVWLQDCLLSWAALV